MELISTEHPKSLMELKMLSYIFTGHCAGNLLSRLVQRMKENSFLEVLWVTYSSDCPSAETKPSP